MYRSAVSETHFASGRHGRVNRHIDHHRSSPLCYRHNKSRRGRIFIFLSPNRSPFLADLEGLVISSSPARCIDRSLSVSLRLRKATRRKQQGPTAKNSAHQGAVPAVSRPRHQIRPSSRSRILRVGQWPIFPSANHRAILHKKSSGSIECGSWDHRESRS